MLTEKVTWVQHWSNRTFSFRCTRSADLNFTAGQFILIGMIIDEAVVVRAYSIASPPCADELEFLSVVIPDGELTSQLKNITVGSEVVMYPRTTGTLLNSALVAGDTLWMLATGTGLAPFMSLIRDTDTLSSWRTINIVHSVHQQDDLAYHEYLSALTPKITYYPIVTGLGHARINSDLLINNLGLNTSTDRIMMCGNISFNKDISAWCKSQGMVEGSIRQPGTFVVERAFVERG